MGFFIALRFLTILPVPWARVTGEGDLARSQSYFPLVGLLLGAILVLLDTVLLVVLPATVSSALVVLGLVVLTGAIHLDGFIDTCDGIFLHRSPAERRDVLRDSRVGSFGAIGGALLLVLKVLALASLAGPGRLAALLIMPTLGRWAMAYAVSAFPYARDSGKGSAFQGSGRLPLLLATLSALAICQFVWPARGLLLATAAVLWASAAARYCSARLGGLTGDTYGAIGETVELLVLLGAVASWQGLR